MRDAFPIVARLGDRLQGEKHGWRDAKALIILVARSGPPGLAWPGAQDLCDALGVSDDFQERIYREVYGTPRTPGERARTCTPDNPCMRRWP